ncbi:hypothetical protein Pa4123_05650 [Phytohabitans aurantiacus]|uniref:Right handed beta helix domain-containing protein n=1 Tax=Phytohabitans aurantiacus TaxID=3016789 RepID=A0ABQ5QLB5_9ACTN|nr:hypothetical protein Pa4123_05650 [Phytohabitans aurantiacus]
MAAAVADPDSEVVRVLADIEDAGPVLLRPGQRLVGEGTQIVFRPGCDGVRLVRDNEVRGLRLRAAPERRAVYNATTEADLGVLALTDLRVVGQVQIVAEGATTTGQVSIRELDLEAADTLERTLIDGYGVVSVRQGALTVWNRQPSDGSVLTARIEGVRVGRESAPVRGAGIVVSGAGDPSGRMVPQPVPAGRVRLSMLDADEVFADGGVEVGTADLIAGGVLVLFGVEAELVRLRAAVITYGVNDMVVDNWGDVERWQCAALTSHGASAVGVVNFGVIGELTVAEPITTYGTGARGLNVYLGHIGTADLHSVDTHGDAAVGIQISQPVRRLVVREGVRTRGGSGPSLVRGEIVELSATALSVLEGGDIDELRLGGGLDAAKASALQVRGRIGNMMVA